MIEPLNLSSLASLPPAVARPNCARAALRSGILHIGVGNFHRAHQAIYLDDLFNKGRGLDWALICGAAIAPPNPTWRLRFRRTAFAQENCPDPYRATSPAHARSWKAPGTGQAGLPVCVHKNVRP